MTTKNPENLPITRKQMHELAAQFLQISRESNSGYRLTDGQWEIHRKNIVSIIDRAPVELPQPFIPPVLSDEEAAEQRRAIEGEKAQMRENTARFTSPPTRNG